MVFQVIDEGDLEWKLGGAVHCQDNLGEDEGGMLDILYNMGGVCTKKGQS